MTPITGGATFGVHTFGDRSEAKIRDARMACIVHKDI